MQFRRFRLNRETRLREESEVLKGVDKAKNWVHNAGLAWHVASFESMGVIKG